METRPVRGPLAPLLLPIVVVGTTLFIAAAPDARAQRPNGRIVDSVEVLYTPAQLDSLEAGSRGMRTTMAQTRVQRITYMSDGLRVRGYLVRPRSSGNATRLPAIIDNRGGNRDFGAWTDLDAARRLARVAAWGYVVVASQYRGVDGGEGIEEFGGADVNDVLNLIPLLDRLPGVDSTRIGMTGWSRGSMMTFIALTRTTRVKAAAIGGTVSDLIETGRQRPEMETEVFAQLIPRFATKRDSVLKSRSAVFWAERMHKQTPILILHGTSDWRAGPSQALRLADALLAAKHPFRLMMFEGGDHGLSEYGPEVQRATREFLDRYVRDGARWPSLEPHGR